MQDTILRDKGSADATARMIITTHPMHVFCAFQQLLHVQFDMTWLQFDPFILQQPGKVVVHIWKHHVDGQRRVLAFACRCSVWDVARMEARLLRTTNMSNISTMQGCLSALRILISRRAVTGMPSFSLCIRIRFSATTRRVVL